MRIEWLNDDMTRARITRGWFRKEWAIVVRNSAADWIFEETGEQYPEPATRFTPMERQRSRILIVAKNKQQWHPVKSPTPLPPARVVERKS